MRIKSAAFLAVLWLLFPASLNALPPVSVLHGSWGFTFLTHNNTGTWEAEGGRLVLNADGTGTIDTFFNDNGIMGTRLASALTYTATVNGNGTITFTMLTPDASVNQLIINDTGDMMFLDATGDLLRQKIGILIKLKPTPYSAADFLGTFNTVGYEFQRTPVQFKGHAVQMTSTGSGNITGTSFTNNSGTLEGPNSVSDLYTVFNNVFFSFTGSGPDVGFVSSDNNVLLFLQHNDPLMGFYFGLRQDPFRLYSNADMMGKWIVTGFRDGGGVTLATFIGSLHFDPSGPLSMALKVQENGALFFSTGTSGFPLHVNESGTFGTLFGPHSPAYAAAIGNGGKTFYINSALSGDPISNNRMFWFGLRCAECALPLSYFLPLTLKQ